MTLTWPWCFCDSALARAVCMCVFLAVWLLNSPALVCSLHTVASLLAWAGLGLYSFGWYQTHYKNPDAILPGRHTKDVDPARHNWPNSQIPECTCSISCNALFRTEMCTFLFWMEHWGIWSRCIMEFVSIAVTFFCASWTSLGSPTVAKSAAVIRQNFLPLVIYFPTHFSIQHSALEATWQYERNMLQINDNSCLVFVTSIATTHSSVIERKEYVVVLTDLRATMRNRPSLLCSQIHFLVVLFSRLALHSW